MLRSTRHSHKFRPRRRLTYANVVSTLCLFVLLGGGAYAAEKTVLPKHSVGARQLKADAVRSAQVKDGSLLARDFRAGQLPAGAQGPQGAPGPRGPQGQTRRSSPAVASWSPQNWAPTQERTRSKVVASNGSAVASPCTQVTGSSAAAERAAPARRSAGVMSSAVTAAPAPAAGSAALPVPHATSRTAWPAPAPASSTSRAPSPGIIRSQTST